MGIMSFPAMYAIVVQSVVNILDNTQFGNKQGKQNLNRK